MHIVTFETAVKMARAGFPRPGYAFGQVWYNNMGNRYVITGVEGEMRACDFVVENSVNIFFYRHLNDGEVFAPNATDILSELGGQYDLLIDGHAGTACILRADQATRGCAMIFAHDNPAEACAKAWLNHYANH